MPLAGAGGCEPVYGVTAPVGVVSVVMTGVCGTTTPFLITPISAPVMPAWLDAE